MSSKYEAFFTDVIRFCTRSNLSDKTSFAGLSEEELGRLQSELGIIFPQALKVYLMFMGHKNQIKGCAIPQATKSSIVKAETQARKVAVRERIRELQVVNQSDQVVEESINETCFLDWVDYNGYFTFVRLDDDACNMYGWDYDKVIYKWEANLISEIRKQILFGLIRISKQKDLSQEQANDLPNGILVDQVLKDRRIVQNVFDFDSKVISSEVGTKKFLGLDDYVNNYIMERTMNNM